MSTLILDPWDVDDHPLAVKENELPVGFIHPGPLADREHQFAVAIPTMLTLMVITALGAIAAAVAGASGPATSGVDGMFAVTSSTLVAILTGVIAGRAGWSGERPAGPWRPLFYGLAVGLSVFATMLWLTWFALVVSA